MRLDLTNVIPEELAETANLEDLWETAKDITWTEYLAEVFDYVYRRRVGRCYETMATPEEVSELVRHLNRVTHPSILEKMKDLEKNYGQRWEAYKDLLGLRYNCLTLPVSEEVLSKYDHLPEILSVVSRGFEIPIKDIQRELKLKSAHSKRLLELMASNKLIEWREKEGGIFIRVGVNGWRLRHLWQK